MDAYYTSRYVPDPSRPIVWKEIVRHHKCFIDPNASVVDLGAGYCDFINEIKADKKYAVDISTELGRFVGPNITVVQSAVWDLKPIPTDSVDVVHASNLLEHLSDEELEKTMSEVKRILKSDGWFILMQPNYRYTYKSYFDDPTHKKIFSHVSLESFLLSHGFSIELMKPKFLPFSLRSRPSLIPVNPFIIRAYIASPWKPFAGQMLFVAKKN